MSDESTEAPEHPPQSVESEQPVEEFPASEPVDAPHIDEPPPAVETAPQAEPGVYRCIAEIAGEHALLGILTEGEEYDYSRADPRTLQAVAAYVELGVLERKGS